MNVALDSDVIIKDPWFRSQDMTALLDYVEKTPWNLVITEVVEAEVFARVRRDVRTALQKAEAGLRAARRYGAEDLPSLDVEATIERTMRRLRERWDTMLSLGGLHRQALVAEDASEAARRAAERLPPCRGEKGQGMRDALTWLCLLRASQPGGGQEELAFVSNNTKDFALDGESLREELREEVRASGSSLAYYPNLENFLRDHAEDVRHITKAWILERVDFEELEAEILFSTVPAHFTDEPTIHPVIRDPEMRALYQIDEISSVGPIEPTLVNFYVWRFQGGDLQVRMNFHVRLEATAFCSLRRDLGGAGYSRPNTESFQGALSAFPSEQILGCSAVVEMQAGAYVVNDKLEHLVFRGVRSV